MQGNNPELKLRCNEFGSPGNPLGVAGVVALEMNAGDQVRPQGAGCILGEDPAGNEWRYNPAGCAGIHIWSDIDFPYFAHQKLISGEPIMVRQILDSKP